MKPLTSSHGVECKRTLPGGIIIVYPGLAGEAPDIVQQLWRCPNCMAQVWIEKA
jgi:hypothetical protein